MTAKVYDILRFSDARNKLNEIMTEVYTSDEGRRIPPKFRPLTLTNSP